MNEHASNDPDRSAVAGRGDSPIRVGSPFADDTIESPQVDPSGSVAVAASMAAGWADGPDSIEKLYDVGPLRYTAMGSVAASIMVAMFAAVAAWWFPSGGVLIAGLGAGLAIFGMYSAYRTTAFLLLTLHLALFVFCYGQAVG